MKYDPNRKYKKGDLVRITGIRIERLQDITWKDAEKEGVPSAAVLAVHHPGTGSYFGADHKDV